MEINDSLLISEEELQSFIVEAVDAVFSTMLSGIAEFKEMKGEEGDSFRLEAPINTENEVVASSVSFAGKVNGSLYIYMEDELSVILTSKMLGMTADKVKNEENRLVDDTMQEIANMTVGLFKHKICALGHDSLLTVPSIVRGKDISISISPTVPIFRRGFHFEMQGYPFVVDVLLKKES